MVSAKSGRDGELGGGQAALDVVEDVVDVLEADGQAHIARRHAGGFLLLRGKLRVGGRGRVDGEAARVADIGDVVDQLQRVDELLAGREAALPLEAAQAAFGAAEILVGPLAGHAGLE